MDDLTPQYTTLTAEEEIIIPPLMNESLGQTIGGFKVNAQELTQGKVSIQGVSERILIGAATAPLTGTGIFMGSDQASTVGYDFRAGNPAGNYIHWDASANTLNIVGTVTVSAGGTIAGFDIGSDYIRDAANSMGLASTVTGGDDVRFWSGAAFASRATAPFRVTESGSFTATSATISGTITATAGAIGGFDIGTDYIRDSVNSMGIASTVTGSDDVRFWAGAAFASRGSAPFRVTEAGAFVATSATISGVITATSGAIGGFTIGASTITATNLSLASGAANTANITVGTGSNAGGLNSANASGDIVFWAGDTFANRATAPFRITAAGALTASSATIAGYIVANKGAFGGDGSDGALSISAGTTTLSAASVNVLIKNYTSISITGTAKVTISNKATAGTILILKSQGAVTITSSSSSVIDMTGMGADGGTSSSTDGTIGYSLISDGNEGNFGNESAGGAAGSRISSRYYFTTDSSSLYRKYYAAYCGSGGGGTDGGGAGGTGGGGLVIECAGALNFTTGTIVASGNPGAAGSQGAGGGGNAGMVLIIYNTLTANSGTITTAGGAGGTATAAGASAWGGGSGAGSLTAAGGSGGAPGANNGSNAGGNGAGGGGGGSNIGGGGTGGTGGGSEGGYVIQNNNFL